MRLEYNKCRSPSKNKSLVKSGTARNYNIVQRSCQALYSCKSENQRDIKHNVSTPLKL